MCEARDGLIQKARTKFKGRDIPVERYELFARYQPQIRSLPRVNPLPKQEILVQDFELARWKNLAQYYAPFDFINSAAKVAIIGITPGLQQMQNAFAAARDALQQGLEPEDALRTAKYAASCWIHEVEFERYAGRSWPSGTPRNSEQHAAI
jgi:hypothetical protein